MSNKKRKEHKKKRASFYLDLLEYKYWLKRQTIRNDFAKRKESLSDVDAVCNFINKRESNGSN